MGTPESVCRGIDMILAVTLCTLLGVALGAPEAEPGHIGYGYHHIGYHHHGPICTTEYEDVVKEFCHYTPDKKCETKSHTYKVVTGYEKGECKEMRCANTQLVTGGGAGRQPGRGSTMALGTWPMRSAR